MKILPQKILFKGYLAQPQNITPQKFRQAMYMICNIDGFHTVYSIPTHNYYERCHVCMYIQL